MGGPCFPGISLRTGAVIVGFLQLLRGVISGIYFVLLLVSGDSYSAETIEYFNSLNLQVELKHSADNIVLHYDPPDKYLVVKIQTGVMAVVNLTLGTILIFGVLTKRKGLCIFWIWMSLLQATLSVILAVLLVLRAFWIGVLIWAMVLVIYVWLIVVVYEYTNEIAAGNEGEEEKKEEHSYVYSASQKIIEDVVSEV